MMDAVTNPDTHLSNTEVNVDIRLSAGEYSKH